MEENLFGDDYLEIIKSLKPKAPGSTQTDVVKFGQLGPGLHLPLVVEPRSDDANLFDWVRNNRQLIESKLLVHGGLLFRGFDCSTQEQFQEFLSATGIELMRYMEGATPRLELGKGVYTSTEYPPDRSIALHNELNYVITWPMKIFFCCEVAPEKRGETPIADVRLVLQRLDPAIRQRFIEKGWMLVRNFGESISLPWQQSFHVSTKEELESYCQRSRVECRWKKDGNVQTRQVRPAVTKHPVTGEPLWFNHVAFWHISSLEPQVREAMLAMYGEEELPYNTYYGDGSRIEDSVVEEIREAYRQEAVEFPWRVNDVLMLDNMLAAHGRNPFVGERKILAAMGEPFTRTEF